MDGKEIHALLIKEGITPSSVTHRGESRIKLVFKMNTRLTDAVRKLKGRKWSKTMGAWHIPKDKKLLDELVASLTLSRPYPTPSQALPAKGKGAQPAYLEKVNNETMLVVTPPIEQLPAALPYLERFTDKIFLKGYSYSTAKIYRSHFNAFLAVAIGSNKDIDTLTKQQIENYLRWRQRHHAYSESDQNLHINAIKFYYEVVLERARMLFTLPRPKKPKQLPAVWAEEDVVKLIKAVDNLKHRTMLLMAYAHGLRVSEVANLKLTDLDSKRMQIHIKAAKGKKDRVVNLSETMIEVLKPYYKKYKPKVYLFENEKSGEPISTRTIQEVFKAAKRKAGLNKKAGVHSLRHSYATHLHEKGVDIKYLKELLGHNSLRTTESYTHVSKKDISKIPSPLDGLKW